MKASKAKFRVGVAGTGFIARGLAKSIEARSDMVVASVLTRRKRESIANFLDLNLLTNSPEALLRNCDILVECSGDPIHASDVVKAAFDAGVPVVTMNAEFHVTAGSWFVDRGLISEAEGDQPGSLAALKEEAIEMGFHPLVYGNCKTFLNRNPTRESMRYWSRKLGVRMNHAISFTDGTKIQIEQALVANGLGAGICRNGLLGLETSNFEAGTRDLAERARRRGEALSDYIIAPDSDVAVFIVAEHQLQHRKPLTHFQMGRGPNYILKRNYHLCYMEIPKTVKRILTLGRPLLTNGRDPKVGVCAIAKRKLNPGEVIKRGIGSFQVRGEAVRNVEYPDHVPIGLLQDAIVTRTIERGTMLSLQDVELPGSQALNMWRDVAARHTSRSLAATNDNEVVSKLVGAEA